MTTEPLTPEDGALAELAPETTPLVETTPFLDNQLKQETKDLIAAIQTIQSRLKNPSVGFDDYMEVLMQQGLTISVARLRELQKEGD